MPSQMIGNKKSICIVIIFLLLVNLNLYKASKPSFSIVI